MVVTRSQGGMDLDQPRVLPDTPRSPSPSTVQNTDTVTQPGHSKRQPATVTHEEERGVAAGSRLPATTGTDLPVAGGGTQRRTARSVRSTASAIARLRFEASERLAAIRRKQLEIDAELIEQKLAADIAELEDDSDQGDETNQKMERVYSWLDQTTPNAAARQRELQGASAPTTDPITTEPTATPRLRRARFGTPEPKERAAPTRRRSPTPRSRGIEQLAETLTHMMSTRPPPRQVTDLPIFSGSPMEWSQFAMAMEQTTKLHRFSPIENLARLRNALRGEARETVAPLLSTASHPDEIMNTLRQCYGRPEIIVDLAMEDLRRLPKMGATASELNTFAVKVQNIVAALKNVDAAYLHNPILVREILDKLSPHMKTKWCDYAEDNLGTAPGIVTLSRFLMEQADRALKHSYSVARKEPAPRPANKPENKKRIFNVTETREKIETCVVCNDQHRLPECASYKDLPISERWDAVKKAGLCFRCISSRHRRFNCKMKPCGVRGCKRPHHSTLHADPPERSMENAASTEEVAVASAMTRSDVKLKICPIIVSGPRGTQRTFALFDEGATISLIDENLAKEIGARGPSTCLKIRGIEDQVRNMESEVVRVKIEASGHDSVVTLRTIADLNLSTQSVPRDIMKLKHLQGMDADSLVYQNAKPRVLLGTDNWPLIITRELRAGRPNQPAASKTLLGWVIHGRIPRSRRIAEEVLHINEDMKMEDLVEHHFRIDSLGVSLAAQYTREEDLRAKKIFEETATRKNGSFEVGLPWKKEDIELPPSYNAALKRLKTLEAGLERRPNEKKQYHEQMENLLRKGYAERCSGNEDASHVAWYLPHFAVRNPNKPGKIRLVFDAAAKANGMCLNDCLLEGPDLLQSLQRILFRFREGAYAVTADIEEMFLRIKIRREDQPAQLFLWRDRPTDEPMKMKMTSMIFGASSSPFLAHSVRNKNALDHAQSHPEALLPITESHYMDDFVESFDDIERAQKVITQVDEVHKKADFHLRGWNSNSDELLAVTPSDRRAKKGTTPLAGTEKTLGLLWNSDTDRLSFNTSMNRVPEAVKSRQRAPTKREALSTVMSIYDPLGLLSCYTITAKINLQKLWCLKTGWDEPIPEDIAAEFDHWLTGLQAIKELQIPRTYNGGREVRRRELHIFCDASEEAYAATAYWRLTYADKEKTEVALVAARAKVAPLKRQTIPRLELQAALIGTRLAKAIKQEHRLRIDDITYWSDSQTVLHWLRNGSRRYTPYVAHRLGEITEESRPADWRWVPTHLNIADVATRAGYVPASEDDIWFRGPSFLKLPKSDWPRPEKKNDDLTNELLHVVTQETNRDNAGLPDIDRFSSYDRLIGATARVLQFVDSCRGKKTGLSHEHVKRATHLWLQKAQQDSFPQEIDCVKKDVTVPRMSPLHRYDLLWEDGLLKLNGRANKIEMATSAKRPVLLNGRHQFTRLLIAREHQRAGHANVERIVNDVRQRYWVTRLRPTVKSIAAACQMCRLRKTKPRSPPIGDLPAERLQPHHRPFSFCGLDYFGPITVTIGRRREKRWCALFTCLTTRAVHLELVASLSTDSAIMALRRMAARRGWPATLYSDNGTNFKGADIELRKAYAEWLPELTRLAMNYETRWKFIAPGAPNQGGAWERLVRSVKSALTTTLRERAPKEETLITLLAEAEHAVNSRPLTHVSVHPDDPEALTPNHFLLGSSSGLPYTGVCNEADRRTWRTAQALADSFWQRWLQEYLPTLVPRLDQHGRHEAVNNGDLVIIADPLLPRNVWPRGIVTHTYPGPDGIIRIVDVQTKGGTFKRPTSKIIVLKTTSAPSSDQ